MSPEELPEPPPPPDAPRHVRLYPYQWIGLIPLVALPVMAIAGVFGEARTSREVRSATLEVRVRHPERFRYKQLNQIEVRVRNIAPVAMDTVRVSFDTAFLARFSTVSANPEFASPYTLALTDIAPGESRPALVQIQAERYGRSSGNLTVWHTDSLQLPLAITVFP